MLYREIIAVCSQIHTKHINTLCGQNVEFLSVKPGGTYSDHWALMFQRPKKWAPCSPLRPYFAHSVSVSVSLLLFIVHIGTLCRCIKIILTEIG